MKLKIDFYYSLSIISYLNNKEEFISASEIGKKFALNNDIVAMTANKLRSKKIIISKKGPNGGYKLNKSLDKIVIKDILHCIDESFNLNEQNLFSSKLHKSVIMELANNFDNFSNRRLSDF